jgi:hypothetical protein
MTESKPQSAYLFVVRGDDNVVPLRLFNTLDEARAFHREHKLSEETANNIAKLAFGKRFKLKGYRVEVIEFFEGHLVATKSILSDDERAAIPKAKAADCGIVTYHAVLPMLNTDHLPPRIFSTKDEALAYARRVTSSDDGVKKAVRHVTINAPQSCQATSKELRQVADDLMDLAVEVAAAEV